MRVSRLSVVVAAVVSAVVVVVGSEGAAVAGAGGAAAGGGGHEVDLAFHGDVTLRAGVVRVRFVPRNHGPSDLADATVRLRWSLPLVGVRRLPVGCLRSGGGGVLCRTGALEAGSLGEPVEIAARVAGRPAEVRVRIGTEWSGGAVDRNPRNNEQSVLALDTGDVYYF
ncbi:hypothetical protein ABZ921_36715 [Streptomyces atriruber]|uniref:DUF11 domain-containing protein n=1 Tax=Streptomyces atriruber TaxID=545121 RepID=A0ABV3BYU2_9ACTN